MDFVGRILRSAKHLSKPVPEGIGQVVIFLFENGKTFHSNICFYHRVKIENLAHVILISIYDSSPDFGNHLWGKIVALWKSRKQGVIVSCPFFCTYGL